MSGLLNGLSSTQSHPYQFLTKHLDENGDGKIDASEVQAALNYSGSLSGDLLSQINTSGTPSVDPAQIKSSVNNVKEHHGHHRHISVSPASSPDKTAGKGNIIGTQSSLDQLKITAGQGSPTEQAGASNGSNPPMLVNSITDNKVIAYDKAGNSIIAVSGSIIDSFV